MKVHRHFSLFLKLVTYCFPFPLPHSFFSIIIPYRIFSSSSSSLIHALVFLFWFWLLFPPQHRHRDIIVLKHSKALLQKWQTVAASREAVRARQCYASHLAYIFPPSQLHSFKYRTGSGYGYGQAVCQCSSGKWQKFQCRKLPRLEWCVGDGNILSNWMGKWEWWHFPWLKSLRSKVWWRW